MGMFSWRCKGCGHEIKRGEYVRLNGCVGTYDGYGCAGGFHYEYDEPSGWHVRCYKQASTEQKLNDDASKHASNQGFGFAALENMEDYNPDFSIKFQACVFVDHYDGIEEKTTKQEWYVVNGVLVDFNLYEKLYSAANSEGDMFDFPDNWDNMSEKDKEDFFQEAQEKVENHIGMKNPKLHAEWFDSFEETKKQVESLISSLPNPDWGYELAIFGKQEKAQGLYYKFNKIPGFNMVDIPGKFYDNGRSKVNFVFNGQFKENVVFVHGRPAGDGVPSY